MSNERIDLTQFKGHTEWLPARTYNEQLLVQMKYAEALAEIARQRQEDRHEVNHADDALVVNATDLIAELKRCYEEIDNLLKEKNRLIDIAERCGAWEGNFDFSDINDEYGACNICGSIPSGCCEASE